MGILMWDTPEKVMSIESWKSISADGAPPGVYTPNMSRGDALSWKAKIVLPRTVRCWDCQRPHSTSTTEGRSWGSYVDPLEGIPHCAKCRASPYRPLTDRVEIRKSVQGAQIVIIISEHGTRISMNGTAVLSVQEMQELPLAIREGQIALGVPAIEWGGLE